MCLVACNRASQSFDGTITLLYMQTYSRFSGGACAVGVQPVNGLLYLKAMARLAVGEVLTNLVWAKVTSLKDVKAPGNLVISAYVTCPDISKIPFQKLQPGEATLG